MLTKLTIRNFKRFDSAVVELGNPVVFIGPNNSGKTTALQALALWGTGLKRWNEKRARETAPEKRPGVALNRRDLIAVPVPDANLLWRDLHVRDVQRALINGKPSPVTRNIRIDIVVEGVTEGASWTCGLEFDYANEESLYCRPLRLSEDKKPARMPIPPQAIEVNVAYLPPMSGLAENETRLDPGAINVRLGEGRTAEVLRNLCYKISSGEDGESKWARVCRTIDELFLVQLDVPKYIPERGEITMTYVDRAGPRLDLASAGRGLQQTLLLLAHLTANPKSAILIDEPDAHLEILRQRQIYDLMSRFAAEHGSQVIAASHSEVVLNEAAGRDTVIAFLGKPHRIDDRGHQLLKSLKEIGYDHFYQAEQTGWVLYLEGSTDLSILRAFAATLGHRAEKVLERPFVQYVANQPRAARRHFYGLREAKADLVGVAVFDRLNEPLQAASEFVELSWSRRGIENYLCQREVLLEWARRYAQTEGGGPLFAPQYVARMEESIAKVESAMQTLGKGSPWSADTKVTDDFLNPLFSEFFKGLGIPNLFQKTDYHVLASLVRPENIDAEVASALDRIADVCSQAKPVSQVAKEVRS
jgi:predicted ATPase